MSILVVGSVGLDTVKTPFGRAENSLGGSATYFSYAASFFSPVRLIAVVGDDFPKEHIDLLARRKIDLQGLQRVPGKTFRWSGSYEYDLNEAQTLSTELNVFEAFRPRIPVDLQDSPFVFLANIDPDLQLDVLKQVRTPRLVACDTMNLWIKIKQAKLREVLERVNIFILNDSEARQLTGQSGLIKAGRTLLDWGPSIVVIKKGEHGAFLFTEGGFFAVPAFPLEEVYDPTGAGDCFAGGFFGSLVRDGGSVEETALRRAIVFGTVIASFNVEKFSLDRLKTLTEPEIVERYRQFIQMTHFEDSDEFDIVTR